MTAFNVDDRVRDITIPGSSRREGTVLEAPSGAWAARVQFDTGGEGLYHARELELIESKPHLVRVKQTQTFVVTLGTEEFELTEQEAYALFRALERVV